MKKQYFKDKILNICTLIDENKQDNYSNYNLNTKIMKSKIIQYSLQLSIDNQNLLSSILYLNEFYKKHFIIVYNSKIYKTSLKNYPKEYILYQNNKFSINHKNLEDYIEDDLKEYTS